METRRALLAAVVFAVMALSLHGGGPAVAGARSGDATASDSLAAGLPRWRLQVRPYSAYDGDYALGVYRRVGTRWDVGLQLALGYDDDDSETDSFERRPDGTLTSDRESVSNNGYSVGLSLDWRHWSAPARELRWFIGPRVSFSRISSQQLTEHASISTERWYRSRDGRDRHQTAVGWAPLVGADLRLRSRLSLTFVLLPVRFTYDWQDTESAGERVSSDETGKRMSYSDAEDHGFSFDSDLHAQLFVVLGI